MKHLTTQRDYDAQAESELSRATGTYPPTEAQKLEAGYRHEPPQPDLAPGYTRLSCTLVEGDGVIGQWQVTDRLTADIEAEERAALLAKCQPYFGLMMLYRIALRRNFGDGAETNREVTQESALAYFGQKTAAGVITTQETADSALMMASFPVLSSLTGDGTTWTLPWEVVP